MIRQAITRRWRFRTQNLASPLLIALAILGASCDHKPAPGTTPATSAGAAKTATGAARSASPAGAATGAKAALGARGAPIAMVATDAGIAVVTGSGRGIELRRYDSGGKQIGSPTLLAREARVADVAAAAVGDRLGVAWIEPGVRVGAAYSVIAGTRGTGFGEVHHLGDVAAAAARKGGHLVARAEDGKLLVFRSGPAEPCRDNAEDQCTSFLVQELMTDGPEPRRIPLSVPAVCERGVAAFSATPGQWLYGVCSRKSGAPVTTIFRVQFSPQYAVANEVLRGCMPRGSAVIDDKILTLGDCAEGRRAVRSVTAVGAQTEVDWSRAHVECDRGGPALVVGAERTPFGKISGDLSALLPDEFVPPGARAVFTGVALFVGAASADGAELTRFECRAGKLVST